MVAGDDIQHGAARSSGSTRSGIQPSCSPKRQRIAATSPRASRSTLADCVASGDDRANSCQHAGTTHIAPLPANARSLTSEPPQPSRSAAKRLSTTQPTPSVHTPSVHTPSVHKRRFTRSRSGCSTCRMRKLKCDEARPVCQRCLQDRRQCQGYTHQQPQPNQPSTQPTIVPRPQSHTLPTSPPPSQCCASRLDSRHQSQPLREQPPTSAHASNPVNAPCPTTPHPHTAPQHLDDWIDLLCASIGNHFQQPTLAPPPTHDLGVVNKLSAHSKPTHHQHTAPTCPDAASTNSNNPTPQCARSPDHNCLSALPSAAIGAHQVPVQPESPAWLHEEWRSIFTPSPVELPQSTPPRRHSSSSTPARTGLSALEHISESELQRRIRALCVTNVQLESLSFFFNTTARCFHLLSADTNVWRIFFAQLASESPIILDLIGCLGLTHLSLTQDHRKKGLAHAHFSRCKTEWDALIGPLHTPQSIHLAASRITTAHRVLEVLAGTILIAHIEQFSRGFATSSCAYTALALTLIRNILASPVQRSARPWPAELDQGPGSAFRFFVRILVWWESMSRTMGPGSERGDVLDIFEHVYRWEEPQANTQDPIECSTQCVVGWPLDLLEAVERTTRLSLHPQILALQPLPAVSAPLVMPSGTLSHALERRVSLELQQQIDAVETQIRLARPLPLAQDDSIAAQLRYLIFECLQSASLVYFCKVLLKSTDAVWFEIDKVTRFLERKQRIGANLGIDATHTESAHVAHVAANSAAAGTAGPPSGDLHLAQLMENRGKWWIRAPDGALIWAYFQCASEIFGALDPSAAISPCVKQHQAHHQIGRGEPTTLALGSHLTLGSEMYSGFAESRSERRQRCRTSLLLWERFDQTQCIFLCRHLLKAIWDRRDLYEQQTRLSSLKASADGALSIAPHARQSRYDQAGELDQICRQRRWRQPLIF